MGSTAEVLKSNRIDELAERLEGKRGEDSQSAEHFLRRFYESVSPGDMLSESSDDLLGAALSLWRFARHRPSGEFKIQIFNPTLEDQGWKCRHTVIEIVNVDQPFLVDSVGNELLGRKLDIHLVIHPVLRMKRDSKGRFLQLVPEGESTSGGRRESLMHIEIDQVATPEEREAIRQGLERVLFDVEASVADWKAMRSRVHDIIQDLKKNPPPVSQEELDETGAFLQWIDDDYFTYLGYREYRLEKRKGRVYVIPIPESGLGILRRILPTAVERSRIPLSDDAVEYARRRNLLLVTKAHSKATVHRAVHMDYVGIKRYDEAGEVCGEMRFLGLFTSFAYSQSVRKTPLLQGKFDWVVARSGLSPTSHDGKALAHILETFPRDELFQISVEDLFTTAMGILQLQERHRLALFVRRDQFGNFVSCQVYLPKDRYNTDLRHRIEGILEKAFNGKIEASHSHLDDSPLARWHFLVRTRSEVPPFDAKQIEKHLAEMARTWSDRLKQALREEIGERRGLALFRRYQKAFAVSYRETFGANVALRDIKALDQVVEGADLALNLYRPVGMRRHEIKFKIYHRGDIALSGIVPILENIGVSVVSEIPYQVRPSDSEGVYWIRDFGLESEDGAEIDLGRVRDHFQETFVQVWRAEAENDTLNRTVLKAGLAAEEVILLRAYIKYLLQTGINFSQDYMASVLNGNPALTRLLVHLFRTGFDPEAPSKGRKHRVDRVRREFRKALQELRSQDEDRIFYRLENLMVSTVRTTFFQRDESGCRKPYLAFKMHSRKVLELPEPKPMFEIFVYSPRFEAVHLRGGKVSRGGIRWSDRQDFRSEILGLMKAQMVKNAVIVPVGAKGGFVLKRTPVGPHSKREGQECYQMMISALLELTDNLKGDQVVPPPSTVRWDQDDPYLVVAADKGTATFSDLANSVAQRHDFWLGDAFASGGSAGYDHKKMGITAKGAFVCVERHFREKGVNLHKDVISVVGVGDMSGDVFGNGMLYSNRLKLLGAFNHMHIFIDLDPDPAKSYAERRRLFEMNGSTWRDYDPKLISKGGGVFDRTSRRIPVSREMKKAFGIKSDEVSPSVLIQALLRARVDLLWFGGIGTYVKASSESDFDAKDRTNDALRVDAKQLRCKVIGEGANLAVTQAGRIEFALRGGQINSDAIDNSGGVGTSDHEVNIKLLLGAVRAKGELTLKQRDKLLVEMTDEISRLVLRDNYLQTQALSLAQLLARQRFDRQKRFIEEMERLGKLNPALENLPDSEELDRRQAAGKGLTRPELAVLLAYAKIDLFNELMASDLPDAPLLAEDLVLYFPEPLRERYRDFILRHRLRREIIATYATNSIVNRVGPTFVSSLRQSTGMSPSEIARAYIITRDVFGLRDMWEAIERLDYKVAAQEQTAWLCTVGDLVERSTRWFLCHRPRPLDVAANVSMFGVGIGKLARSFHKTLSRRELEAFEKRREEAIARRIPKDLARRLASIAPMESASDIVSLAEEGGLDVVRTASVYFAVGGRFDIGGLRLRAARFEEADAWRKAAAAAVLEQLFEQQKALTRVVIQGGGRLDTWLESHASQVQQADARLEEIRSGKTDLNKLVVAAHQLRLMAIT